jgi:hypothetical protein
MHCHPNSTNNKIETAIKQSDFGCRIKIPKDKQPLTAAVTPDRNVSSQLLLR